MKFFIALATLLTVAAAAEEQLHHPFQFENELQYGAASGKEADERIDGYSHGFTLECDYAMVRHYWGEMYTCLARNLVTRHHYDYIVNATGDHMSGKGDRDVRAIYILGQRTPFLPYNLTTPFGGSVVALRVEASGLRYLNRTLRYEGALEYLHLENNLLEEVPVWALRNMTTLKWLSLRRNHIRYLEGTLLSGMTKLRRFSVSGNRIEVIPSGLFHDTVALEEIYFYNNKIRMIGWKLVNLVRGLKVAAFAGNPCTDISIYDGVNVIQRLSGEFKTKCAVDCRRADAAAQNSLKDVRDYYARTMDCVKGSFGGDAANRMPYSEDRMRQHNRFSGSGSFEN